LEPEEAKSGGSSRKMRLGENSDFTLARDCLTSAQFPLVGDPQGISVVTAEESKTALRESATARVEKKSSNRILGCRMPYLPANISADEKLVKICLQLADPR
jgi:hypothetical protein